MQSDAFMIQWLAERSRYDEEARHAGLLEKCVQKASDQNFIRVMDLGCGTGNNFFLLHPRLPAHQEWLMIDHNEKLLTEAGARIIDWADDTEWKVQTQRNQIILTKDGREIDICLVRESVLEPQRVTSKKVNLYAANALFDLFTESDWLYFLDQVNDKPVLYFTLNVTGNKILPDRPLNRKYTGLFESHMSRNGEGGRLMGTRCVSFMTETLQKAGYQVDLGKSNWHLGENDKEMLRYMIQFMEDSLPEILKGSDKKEFKQWLEQTYDQIEENELEFFVSHQDLLAY